MCEREERGEGERERCVRERREEREGKKTAVKSILKCHYNYSRDRIVYLTVGGRN